MGTSRMSPTSPSHLPLTSLAEIVKQLRIAHIKLGILLAMSHIEEVKELSYSQAQLKEAV